jgi:hypothetical protein
MELSETGLSREVREKLSQAGILTAEHFLAVAATDHGEVSLSEMLQLRPAALAALLAQVREQLSPERSRLYEAPAPTENQGLGAGLDLPPDDCQ